MIQIYDCGIIVALINGKRIILTEEEYKTLVELYNSCKNETT